MAETPLSVPLDRTSPVPLYFQLAQELERRIREGELPPGTRLENEILLADRLGLSRPTLRRAIEYLVDQGLLVRKRGVGTQVVTPGCAARWSCPASTTTWSRPGSARAPRCST